MTSCVPPEAPPSIARVPRSLSTTSNRPSAHRSKFARKSARTGQTKMFTPGAVDPLLPDPHPCIPPEEGIRRLWESVP